MQTALDLQGETKVLTEFWSGHRRKLHAYNIISHTSVQTHSVADVTCCHHIPNTLEQWPLECQLQ